MNNRYNHVYLSPHLDDAILSCGSLINKQKRHKESVLIITIFAGIPQKDYKLSRSISKFIKESGSRSSTDFCRTRIKEDIDAIKLLNISFKHLNFLDAIYRKNLLGDFFYANFSKIFSIYADKSDIVKESIYRVIKGDLKETSIIYCPISIGKHIDHIITRQVGNLLESQGQNILFYEDIYTLDYNVNLYLRRYERDLIKYNKYSVSNNDLIMHERAINCYKTQIKGLIRGTKMSVKGMVRKLNHKLYKNQLPYINLWHY